MRPTRRLGRGYGAVLLAGGILLAGMLGRLGLSGSSAQDGGPDGGALDERAVPDAESPDGASVEAAPEARLASASGEPQEVIVGAYLRNVERIDLPSNSYSLSAVVWMKWRGDIDPTRSFRLSNVIDRSSLTIEPQYPAPIDVEGYRYQRFEVEGTFFHKFWLGTFPLDWQRVTLEIEDTQHVRDELVYVADTEDSGVDPLCRLPGWRIVEETNEAFDVDHGSDYGLGSLSWGREFTGYRFGLRIERPISFYLFKIIPPILITLACCFLVFLLQPTYVDARVGTPIAALLTAVFLQLTFTGGLPNLGIMLLLDHIFNLTYTTIFVIVLLCILTTRWVDEIEADRERLAGAVEEAEAEELRERIATLRRRMNGLDRKMLIVLPTIYLAAVVVTTIAVRGSYVFEMLGR